MTTTIIIFIGLNCEMDDIDHMQTTVASYSHSSSSKCHHFYFNRLWNSLPSIDITLSLPLIKMQLDQYFHHHFINNFNPPKSCSFHYLCTSVYKLFSFNPLSPFQFIPFTGCLISCLIIRQNLKDSQQ